LTKPKAYDILQTSDDDDDDDGYGHGT